MEEEFVIEELSMKSMKLFCFEFLHIRIILEMMNVYVCSHPTLVIFHSMVPLCAP